MELTTATLDASHHDLTLAEDTPHPVTEVLAPHQEIYLSDVNYAYSSTPGGPVLDHFDTALPVGTSEGIVVGRTGACKCTLMDILLGLPTPQIGVLSVDGPMNANNVAACQCTIDYRTPTHLPGRRQRGGNIAFGAPCEVVDTAAMEHAVQSTTLWLRTREWLRHTHWRQRHLALWRTAPARRHCPRPVSRSIRVVDGRGHQRTRYGDGKCAQRHHHGAVR